MGSVKKNISQHELDCKCGSCGVTIQPHEPIIQRVQDCCDYFASKYQIDRVVLHITSAARCYKYNREVGSSDGSQHPRCNAMDIAITANGEVVPPKDIYDWFDEYWPDTMGLGLYEGFVHVDTRECRARW